MRTTAQITLLASMCLLFGLARCCDMEQTHNGCKIAGTECHCAYGCKTEYPFRSKKDCMMAYREYISNICSHVPCVRGTCIQTSHDPGYTCRCEGTGFHGQRCEKACPTAPVRGRSFPYECIVI